MRPFKSTLGLGLVVLSISLSLSAAVPQLISYQGRLTTPAGQAVTDGSYLMRFRIYDAPVGGTLLWDNGFRAVPVAGGLFTYQLGDSTVLPQDLFLTDTVRYLGIAVGVDAEMTPRVRLASAAYAHTSLHSDTAAFSEQVGTIDGASAGTITGSLTVAASAGNSAVVLPNSSISSQELVDEAGVSIGYSYGVTPGAPTVVVGDTIHCPAAGWVIAMVSGEAQVIHSQGIGDHALIGLSESKAGFADTLVLNIAVNPSLPTSPYEKPFSTVAAFDVSSAGTKSIYLVGQNLAGIPFTFYNCHIVLLYVPSYYGTSPAPAPADGARPEVQGDDHEDN